MLLFNLKLANKTPTKIIKKFWEKNNYIKKIVQQPQFAYFSILIESFTKHFTYVAYIVVSKWNGLKTFPLIRIIYQILDDHYTKLL
jgi:hypothetical protein